MEYIFKNISDSNGQIDEMKEGILDNIDTLNKLLNEVEKLRLGEEKADFKEKVSKELVDEKVVLTNDLIEEEDDTLIEEINYYYSNIRDFNLVENEECFELLRKELPSKRKSNYQDIILGITTFFIKDINEIKNFIESEKNILSTQELEDFKKDIFDIQRKINTIFYLSHNNELKEEKSLENTEVLNNIVFLETESGNFYALEDLDNNSVPSEYYEGFYELIHSIEDGTFKNVKFLASGNYKTAGISEVKGFKKRVIFDRVGYNTYAILGAYIKKSDKDKSYLEPLKNRIAIYRRNRDNIVKRLNTEKGYLDSQKEVLEQIYQLLGQTKKKRGQ